MSEKQTTKPEVTQEVKSEGGDMKIKSKPKQFKTTKDKPFKVDLSKVDTSLEANTKVEEPIKVDLTKTEDDAIPIGETKELPLDERTGDSKGVDGEVRVSDTKKDVQVQESESPIVEVEEEEVQDKIDEIILDKF